MTRTLLRLDGRDTHDFLQGLVTNDINKLSEGPIYAALLTPQGKYIADFFLISDGETAVLMDVDASLGTTVQQRLGMYKLRADVQINLVEGMHLHRGLSTVPDDGWTDPRHASLGWRAWRNVAAAEDDVDWNALRVENLVPETGLELSPDSFILEHNFEALNGVDFRKGCYVGQEVTARMKHKTELRKGLTQVAVLGSAEPGDAITANGKQVGTLTSRAGDHGLAYLRFDRVSDAMSCGAAVVTRV